ncbi:MAG: aminopeptidase P family protein [Bacteroidota bacterium]
MAFSQQTYLDRRAALQARMNDGLAVFMGNREVGMNYAANIYPFRQDSNFLYFFGIDQPDLAAIIDFNSGETCLYGNDLTVSDIVWVGPHPTLQEYAQKVGVTKTKSRSSLLEDLRKAKSANRAIHYLPPYRMVNTNELADALDRPWPSIKGGASVELIQAVVAQRSIKSAEEVVEMEKALATTYAMHVAMLEGARPGMKESQLTGIVAGIAASMGGHLAYPIILTTHGEVLHNHHHHHTMQSGQLVLGDFGASAGSNYASDITRTGPVDPTFTTKQKEIYQIVLDAEVQAIEQCRPGIPYAEMHQLASRVIAQGLTDLGLMQGDPVEAVAAGAHALFFPHGLGHMIGLDVHDMEDLGEDLVGYDEQVKRSEQFGTAYLRLGRELQEGFVLTVEPGIYFIPTLIEQWRAEQKHAEFINYQKLESYLDFGGIRIEDNVLITREGQRVLGPPIPKTIQEIETLRAD